MILFPNAKINIGLSVIRKRCDGFHDIETIMYPIGLYDALEYIEETEGTIPGNITTITYSGNVSITGQEICLKVIQMLEEMFPLPSLKIHLLKKIPVGAGLGGGSSDAAFLLISLNKKYSLGLSRDQLEELAGRIGGDCPFFIRNKPCFISGKGELLRDIPIKLDGYWLFLVYPGIIISTKEAYQQVIPGEKSVTLHDLVQQPPDKWRNTIKNQFEDSVFRKYPVLAEIKDELYRMGAVYSSMSGSGSGIYGIFNSEVKIPEKFKSYFTYQECLK